MKWQCPQTGWAFLYQLNCFTHGYAAGYCCSQDSIEVYTIAVLRFVCS